MSAERCGYVGTEPRRIESEVTIEEGHIQCGADAEIVVRLAHNIPARKRNVCRKHAQFLRSDECEIDWEWCGNVRELNAEAINEQ